MNVHFKASSLINWVVVNNDIKRSLLGPYHTIITSPLYNRSEAKKKNKRTKKKK